MPGFSPTRGRGGGYTLLEMLIVLALLVVLVGISYPALRGSLEKSRLYDAAKQLRVELARARVEAIETGTAWQFKYEEGSGQYQLGSALPSEDARQLSWQDMQAVATVGEHELPDGITFAPPDTTSLQPEIPQQDMAAPEGQWSGTISFYPNGRSDNAHVRLLGARGMYVDLMLRGITGTAKVGTLQQSQVTP